MEFSVNNLRRGMWVTYQSAPAVVYQLEGATAEIHLVDPAGLTLTSRIVLGSDLRQARLEEIPLLRRPSPALAARFGYT